MKTHSIFALLALLLALSSCGKKNKSYDETGLSGLTTRTENLKENITQLPEKGVLIGQFYGTLEGVEWQNDSARSDIHSICNDWPAVNGYELAGVESGKKSNVDGFSFAQIRKNALTYFKQGGLIVMNWTMPDYQNNDKQLASYVQKLAEFINNLQNEYGIKAPVVLNLLPYDHKAWYCQLSAEDYQSLYSDIQNQLNDHDVNNVVYGYAENYTSGSDFLSHCPDDISCLQLNYCQPKAQANTQLYRQTLEDMLVKGIPFAQEHQLSLGLMTGMEGITDAAYFEQVLIPCIESHRLLYLMMGRNHGNRSGNNFYTPFPGHDNTAISGFMTLFNNEKSIFLSQLNGLYLKR
ncbi:hypothetical protein [Prevotella sp.]|uniref:hypothetical protein n=1 Tax=Prevotella sp. TaxID=59823 RepID=UPI002F956C10